MIIATGSQLDRIARCPASGALPQVVTAESDDPSPERGTAIHRFLERVPVVGRDAALEETPEQWRSACAVVDLGALAAQLALSHEVAIAYDWRRDTARILAPVTPRAYEIDPHCEIPFTVDVIGADTERRIAYVGDYKGPHAWLPLPGDSYQLAIAAVAVARLYCATSACVEYVRIRDDGSVHKQSGTLDAIGLDDAAARIADLVSGLPDLRSRIEAGHSPDVVEGRWCRYCPSRQHCPAKTALIRRVLHTEPAPYTQPLDQASAAELARKIAVARAALKGADAALYAYAKLTPVLLETEPDGTEHWLGEWTRPGNEVLDGPIAHRVLAEIYGGEAANAAVEMTTTKSAITDAIRSAMPRDEKITHHTKRAFDAIRAAGGASNPTTTTTVEHTVGPDGKKKVKR